MLPRWSLPGNETMIARARVVGSTTTMGRETFVTVGGGPAGLTITASQLHSQVSTESRTRPPTVPKDL